MQPPTYIWLRVVVPITVPRFNSCAKGVVIPGIIHDRTLNRSCPHKPPGGLVGTNKASDPWSAVLLHY